MTSDIRSVFQRALEHAIRHREESGTAPVRPSASPAEIEAGFDGPTPEKPQDWEQVIDHLARAASPGLMRTDSPRFFAWVIGASNPVGVAADWLTSAWGQNAGLTATAPAAALAEKVAARWLLDLLDLPPTSSVGFVTGATMASFACLAAARTASFLKLGWDVDSKGLLGAPPIRVIVGADAHISIFVAPQYLGLGRDSMEVVATDDQGRMLPGALETTLKSSDAPAIVISQAGQINTGAMDPFSDIVPICRAHNAWLHVDGAFGLWAQAAPDLKHLTRGIEGADSWATDGHKWLQLPYDTGFAIVRDAAMHRRALTIAANYLQTASGAYDPSNYAPELSRRARGFAAWAVIKALGREGIAEIISRDCRMARRAADLLSAEPGVRILNDVTLNQVTVDLAIEGPDRDAGVRAVLADIHRENVAMAESAGWRGRMILRISVTSENTRETDIDMTVASIIRAWRASPHYPRRN